MNKNPSKYLASIKIVIGVLLLVCLFPVHQIVYLMANFIVGMTVWGFAHIEFENKNRVRAWLLLSFWAFFYGSMVYFNPPRVAYLIADSIGGPIFLVWGVLDVLKIRKPGTMAGLHE